MRRSRWYLFAASLATFAMGAAFTVPAPAEAASTPKISVSSFNLTFSVMKSLTGIAKEGKGKIAAILPTTTSSTRYVEFDSPYLKESMKDAGVPSSDIVVQNALGSTSGELSDAQSDISNGAKVLVVDPLDSGTGFTSIESYAKAPRGPVVIDYDRLTLGGSRKYYVSFNNVQVGKLIGSAGLVTPV